MDHSGTHHTQWEQRRVPFLTVPKQALERATCGRSLGDATSWTVISMEPFGSPTVVCGKEMLFAAGRVKGPPGRLQRCRSKRITSSKVWVDLQMVPTSGFGCRLSCFNSSPSGLSPRGQGNRRTSHLGPPKLGENKVKAVGMISLRQPMPPPH